MPRLLAFLFVVALVPPVIAEEPSINGRKMGEWVTMLKEDTLPRKRKAAALSLSQLMASNTNAQKEGIPILAKQLKIDSNSGVRAQLATILGQQPTEAAGAIVPDLAEALRAEKDSEVRKELAVSLGRYGKFAGSGALPLIDVLKDPAAATRTAAAEALGRIGKDARKSAPALIATLDDKERAVCLAAVSAIGRVDPDDGEAAAEALLKVLTSEQAKAAKAGAVGAAAIPGQRDAEMISACIVSLGLLGEKTPDIVKAIAKQLADPDVELRQLAATTLGKFGPIGRVVSAELKKSFETDANKLVRAYAAHSLGSSYGKDGAKDLIPLLVERLKNEQEFEVRIAIVEELGGLGAEGKPALPALQQARRDAQLKVREAAVNAIRQIEKPIVKEKPKDP